jgi:hypothetical protein
MCKFLWLFTLSAVAFAQECPTIYGAFAGYSPNASPKVTGGGLVASLFPGMKCDPTVPQFHTYTQYIESPIKLNGAWTLQQTISTGAALPFYKLPFGEFWALGTLGAKVTGSTSSVGLGTTYGGGISIPVKNSFKLFPAYQRVNGKTQILLAFLF